jgi:hypothetical protein
MVRTVDKAEKRIMGNPFLAAGMKGLKTEQLSRKLLKKSRDA